MCGWREAILYGDIKARERGIGPTKHIHANLAQLTPAKVFYCGAGICKQKPAIACIHLFYLPFLLF